MGALKFDVLAQCSRTKARVTRIALPNHSVDAPVFMPVGTQGTMKGIDPEQLREMGCQIMLSNTYHLGHRPGDDLLNKAGGLHSFMRWDRALLTDSGGFQMVSLLKLSEVTEEGVRFQSPRDGSMMLLTPERSIELQNAIGADIIMQLDDVVPTLQQGPRVEEALHRTLRWLDRCIAAHKRPDKQNLFPIVQGGTDLEMRAKCIEEMVKRDLPGHAIGGLSGGEEKEIFCRVVDHCTDLLPRDKPIYCMGVGYAIDLVVCVALGVDMFDCVFPTRTARFGTALTRYGSLSLKNSQFETDFSPIEEGCACFTCRHYTRAFLHTMIQKETDACHLVTIHNLSFQLSLMRQIRESIMADMFPEFIKSFLQDLYGSYENVPSWVFQALSRFSLDLHF